MAKIKAYRASSVHDCKVTWKEVTRNGTISDKSFTTTRTIVDWHLKEMRKNPDLKEVRVVAL